MHPVALEQCDGKDNDCDGEVDEFCLSDEEDGEESIESDDDLEGVLEFSADAEDNGWDELRLNEPNPWELPSFPNDTVTADVNEEQGQGGLKILGGCGCIIKE